MKRGFLRNGLGDVDMRVEPSESRTTSSPSPVESRSPVTPPAAASVSLLKDCNQTRPTHPHSLGGPTELACIPFGASPSSSSHDTLFILPSSYTSLLRSHPTFHTSLTPSHLTSVSVLPIPSKGLGLFATRDLAQGECFLHERPLLMLSHSLPAPSLHPSLDDLLSQHMSSPRKAAYDALHNCHPAEGGGRSLGIASTNALAVEWPEGSGETFSCVCELISRANHDCTRNTQADFNYETFCLELTCIRPIPKGGEITIHYVETLRPSRERRADLLAQWRFTCMCASCDPLSPTHAASERRRVFLRNCFLAANAQATPETTQESSLWTDTYISSVLHTIDAEGILDLRGYLLARLAIAEDLHRERTGRHGRARGLAERAMWELGRVGMGRDGETRGLMEGVVEGVRRWERERGDL